MGVRSPRVAGARRLVCERSLTDDERNYYVLSLDATASLRDLVTVVRSRCRIKQQSRQIKDDS
jgi:hypothetical protein